MVSDIRFEHYLKYAVVPAMGAVTASLSAGGDLPPTGFYHYGGPAITVDRTQYINLSTFGSPGSELVSASGFLSAGVQTFATDGGAEVFSVINLNADIFTRSYKEGTSGPTEFNDKVIRGAGVGGPGLVGNQMLQAGDEIDIRSSKSACGTLAADKSKAKGVESKTLTSTAFTTGDWLTDGEEVRGIIGMVGMDVGEGWIDIGWDNDSVVIYDWAVNFDGQIVAGQTEAAAAVPGAGGIAALAMGAAGLRRRRKRTA